MTYNSEELPGNYISWKQLYKECTEMQAFVLKQDQEFNFTYQGKQFFYNISHIRKKVIEELETQTFTIRDLKLIERGLMTVPFNGEVSDVLNKVKQVIYTTRRETL